MTTHPNPASLTDDEHAALKRQFTAFMDANPHIPQRAPIASPFMRHLLRVPAVFAAIFLVVGGSAFAAENSLPNDILYPVKTKIIEPVFIKAPARTPLAKAKAGQALVERRLKEAEALVDRNEVDTESVAIITEALEDHTRDVQDYVYQATQEGQLSEALAVGTDLENVLEAHSEVLETISDDKTVPTEQVADLIEAIADQADEAEEVSEDLEDEAIATSTPETDEYLTNVDQEVRKSIDDLRASLTERSEEDKGTELVKDADSKLRRSEEAFSAGTSYLTEGKKGAALPHLREALQNAKQGRMIIDLHEELSDD